MTRSKMVFIALVSMLTAAHSYGQLYGLPIASDAAPKPAGGMALSGGLVLGDNANLYGVRGAFNVSNEMFLFGDIGMIDPDGAGSSELALQAGAQYVMPRMIDAPVDVALRLALGYASFDDRFPGGSVDVDLWTLMGGAVVSHRIDNMFSVYGLMGLNYAYADAEVRGLGTRRSDSDSEIDPALGVGLLVDITPNLSLYGEFMHIDDPWFGIGARWAM